MPTEILARRMAAYTACRVLHKAGELDDSLQPIGKESFRAFEADWEDFELESNDAQIVIENSEPRPGTTKRRQYYYKRVSTYSCNIHFDNSANNYKCFTRQRPFFRTLFRIIIPNDCMNFVIIRKGKSKSRLCLVSCHVNLSS